jgi:amino acid permease
MRASIARMIGDKYTLPRSFVPNLRRALGLDDPDIGQAFDQLHGQPIETIYAVRLPWRERLRWIRAKSAERLETLPPFWTAFALTLTETVGAGILALPIAFATVGAIGGLIALAVLGVVNMLTIAAMAEAVARNGNMRYGRAYFGRMVGDYLGPAGTLILSPAITLLYAIILLAYFIGLPESLADATDIRPELWAVGLFLIIVFYLRREDISATVATALLVGATSISLIVLLSVIALPHVTSTNLRHTQLPFWHGQPFDSSILELIFGVVLCAFFGHTTTANCAAVVLTKDPSARSLIHGAVAAMATALGLYSLWVIAVNGTVPSTILSGDQGTALGPLADEIGPIVNVLGIVFVIVAMGMASIHMSLGLAYQVRDWLPAAGRKPQDVPSQASPPSSKRSNAVILSRDSIWRTVSRIAPAFLIFVLAESLFFSNRASFAGLFGFLGVITVPIVAGVFSMLMLYAARKKGDCAVGSAWRFLGHPVVVSAITALFIASILVHGLFLWDDPLRRVIAIGLSVVIVAFAISTCRTAFVSRAVIELRMSEERVGTSVVNVVARGRPEQVDILRSENGRPPFGRNCYSQETQIQLRPLPVRELKIWAHRLSSDGLSHNLSARAEIHDEHHVRQVDIGLGTGQVVVQTDGTIRRVTITHVDDGSNRSRS